jgi:hypothetical protein
MLSIVGCYLLLVTVSFSRSFVKAKLKVMEVLLAVAVTDY